MPYQHYTSSRPLAINAIYCIDPFTVENGATLVVPGSHRQEPFPSDAMVRQLETPAPASAGSFIVLDCMVYHTGSANRTDRPRRAVNHVFTLPMIRQQIDLASVLGEDPALPEAAQRLFGKGAGLPRSVADFYAGRFAKVKG